MPPPRIRLAQAADYEAIAALIAQQNNRPQTQCIHSGEGAINIYQQILDYEAANEIRLSLAETESGLQAVLGAEYDANLSRAWFWGPFALHPEDSLHWAALLRHLNQHLPPLKQNDAFVNEANQAAQTFYREQGFDVYSTVHVYAAQPPTTQPAFTPCPSFEARWRDDLNDLHQEFFPNTYEPTDQMIAKCDDLHRLFVWVVDDKVVGYIFADMDSTYNEGHIHYLGVHANWRRQGLGRQLLLSALNWLFTKQAASAVNLTVLDNLVNAQQLYESVGFQLKFTGVALRQTLAE
jgi:ribosomal protein S18 acetylase RimI-like enzyme